MNIKMIKDVIYKPLSDEEVEMTQQLAIDNGFLWDVPNHGKSILFHTLSDCTFFILRDYGDDIKFIYRYTSECDKHDVINSELPVNKGEYKYFDEFYKLSIYLRSSNHIDYNKKRTLVYENNTLQVLKFDNFNDFDNLEYRKGSKEYGGILIKLLEFLRLYDTSDIIEFTLTDFEKKSKMKIDDIKKLIQSKENGNKLFDFNIDIKGNKLIISNLNKVGKNRPFESNIS